MFELRPARAADASILTAIAVRSKAVWGYSREFMKACEGELTVTAADIESDAFDYVVAASGDVIAGFYALERTGDGQLELEALFVDPDFIGKGAGRLLIDDARRTALARGASSIVIQADPNALDFYLAAGGRQVGFRESGSIAGRQLPLVEIDVSAPADR